MEIIQITDLHISRDIDQEKHDCCPYERLKHSLSEIKRNHGNDASLVITGDLSSDYSRESYENIKTLLKQYRFQISLLPGNHDDLNNMTGICDDQISLDQINIKNSNFITHNIDTHIQDNVQGCIKDKDLREIMSEVERIKENVIFFTHHPIIKINSLWIDKNVTENNNALIQCMLKRSDLLFFIFSGHVHQEFHHKINNVEFFTSPSSCYQFKSETDDFAIDKDASYGYRVISLHGNSLDTKVVRL